MQSIFMVKTSNMLVIIEAIGERQHSLFVETDPNKQRMLFTLIIIGPVTSVV